MAAGILNFRNYVIISLIVAAIVFLIGLAFHDPINSGLNQLAQAGQATGVSSTITNLVTEPLRAAFNGGVIGALAAGFLWPATLFWLILIVILFTFSVLGKGFSTASSTIRS